jgi:hypothetical protein
MTVRVRSADGGELEYESLAAVRRALAVGLVGPEDEVLEPGQGSWRRAGSLGPPPSGRARLASLVPTRAAATVAGGAVAALTALAALLLLRSSTLTERLTGLAIAFGLAGVGINLLGWALRTRRGPRRR